MALCGQVFKLKINDKEERDKTCSILAGNGYPVWIEEQNVSRLTNDYYVCYIDHVGMVQKLVSNHDHTFHMGHSVRLGCDYPGCVLEMGHEQEQHQMSKVDTIDSNKLCPYAGPSNNSRNCSCRTVCTGIFKDCVDQTYFAGMSK